MGLETVEIVMDLEDHFGVDIPDAAASASITVADLQSVIVDLLVAKGSARTPELQREVWDGMMAILAKQGYPVAGLRPDSKWVGDITRYG